MFFVYALFAILLRDTRYGLTQLLASLAFGQELLLFHSTRPITWVWKDSITCSSISFQGPWLVFMGFMLWTPGFIPKGYFMNSEEGHKVVRYSTDQALHRAKSLVNMEFTWLLIVVLVFVSLYLVLVKIYSDSVEYQSLSKDIEFGEESDGTESQKTSGIRDKAESFAPFNIGK